MSLPQDYCASKFGAVGFHESLTHELLAENLDGIKTTLVCPYIVDTGMFAGCEIRYSTTIEFRGDNTIKIQGETRFDSF